MINISRFRVQGFYPCPTGDNKDADYAFVGASGAVRDADTLDESIAAVREISEQFPACIYITITRGEWK